MAVDNFPNDENGDALRNMASSGDDLSKARDVDFSVMFPDKASASQFLKEIEGDDFRSELEPRPGSKQAWDVTVTCFMVPTHASITSLEDRLGKFAGPLGGWNDGWGCFAVPI